MQCRKNNNLTKFSMIKECDIAQKGFSGSYDLYKYIVQKYTHELPYDGYVTKAVQGAGYAREHHFERLGVSLKLWIILSKDLFIAVLTGRIKSDDYKTLHELKKEHQELQKK